MMMTWGDVSFPLFPARPHLWLWGRGLSPAFLTFRTEMFRLEETDLADLDGTRGPGSPPPPETRWICAIQFSTGLFYRRQNQFCSFYGLNLFSGYLLSVLLNLQLFGSIQNQILHTFTHGKSTRNVRISADVFLAPQCICERLFQ